MKSKLLVVVSLAFSLSCEPGWAEDKQEASQWKPLTGTSLRSAFENMELGDDVHFAYRFRPDGSFEGTEMAKHVRGRWRTTAREFCWHWTQPPGDEECHAIKRYGQSIRAYRNGVEVWSGDLTSLRE